jgi:4-oxalocrotonate tautomerase
MPIVNITMIEGRTDNQKQAMFKEVTEAIHRTLGAPRESVRIMINEVPARHFATAGVAKTGPSSASPSLQKASAQ